MIETYAIVAVALLAAGIVVGVVAIVSIGIHHEKRAHSLTDASSPSQAASAARAFHGLYTRTSRMARPGTQQRDNLFVLTGGGGLPS